MSSSDQAAPAAAAPKPLVKAVTLKWSGQGLKFEGAPEGVPASIVDAGGKDGPSPMDHLLLAAAGCMSADVVDILTKGRVNLERMQVEISGTRAPEPPRRFTSIAMVFTLGGPLAADRPKVERAVKMSHETYCSVLHTLRPDLELSFEIRLD
jgi:putative redox protein